MSIREEARTADVERQQSYCRVIYFGLIICYKKKVLYGKQKHDKTRILNGGLSMDRAKQWNYAISLLQGFGINVVNDRMTFTGSGRNLIIHSKQLCNCIQIKKQDTEDDIFKRIQKEIKIKLMEIRRTKQ